MYLFRSKKLKLDHIFKFKIDGKSLILIHSVKHLGVLLDISEQSQIKLTLNYVIGILSRLRSVANLNTLGTAYYSFFQSHLQFSAQQWARKIKEIMQKLQNHALRKIYFKNFTIL